MMYIGYKNYSELTSNIFLLGQEAVCVGIKGGLRDFDSVITSYRAHGFAYVMGISVLGVLSELTGKVSGCVRGKVTFCNVVAIGEVKGISSTFYFINGQLSQCSQFVGRFNAYVCSQFLWG